GEWFRTGDVYYVDADGHWVHCGRQDDLFKVAGQWVVPADVEAVALRHPAVLDAGLVGAAEVSGLVKPYLFVVPREAPAGAGRAAHQRRAREALSLRGAARGAGGCRRALRRAAGAAGARDARACASPRDHRGAGAA